MKNVTPIGNETLPVQVTSGVRYLGNASPVYCAGCGSRNSWIADKEKYHPVSSMVYTRWTCKVCGSKTITQDKE